MPTLAIRKTCNPTGNIVTYQGKMANETIKCVPVSRAEDIELVRNENSLVSIFSEVKIHSYKLNVKDKLSQKLIDLQRVSVCEEKDGGRQHTLKLNSLTYQLIVDNLINFGDELGGVEVKRNDVDSAGSHVQCQYVVNIGSKVMVSVTCYNTTSNVLVQLMGKMKKKERDSKITKLRSFIEVNFQDLISRIECAQQFFKTQNDFKLILENELYGIQSSGSTVCSENDCGIGHSSSDDPDKYQGSAGLLTGCGDIDGEDDLMDNSHGVVKNDSRNSNKESIALTTQSYLDEGSQKYESPVDVVDFGVLVKENEVLGETKGVNDIAVAAEVVGACIDSTNHALVVSPYSQRDRPKRNLRKPSKFLPDQDSNILETTKTVDCQGSQDTTDSLLSHEVTWDDDTPCSVCQSMSKDEELESWIQCSFCTEWCHGSCVDLQFTEESAKGIMRFKCPTCRNSSAPGDSDDDWQKLANEKEDMTAKMDKLNFLLDQATGELDDLKRKEKELMKQAHEDNVQNTELVRSLKSQITDLKRDKSQLTAQGKQTKTSLNSQINDFKNEIRRLKQENDTAEKRSKVLKHTVDSQSASIDLHLKKIAELEKIVEDNRASGISQDRILDLESSLSNQETLYNTVLSKLGTAEKDVQSTKQKLLKSERSNSELIKKIEQLNETIQEKEKENAAHVDLVKQVLEKSGENVNSDEVVPSQAVRDGIDGGENGKTSADNNNELEDKVEDVQQSSMEAETDQVKSLKQAIRKRDNEIKNLKSRLSALEGTLADANLNVSSLKEQALVSKAEADREKEINNSLLLRIRRLSGEPPAPMTPPRPNLPDLSCNTPQIQHPQGIMSFSTPRIEHSDQGGEYVTVDSYYHNSLSQSTMSPQLPSSISMNNQDFNIVANGEQTSMQDVVENQSGLSDIHEEVSGTREICDQAFKFGRNSCPHSCVKRHDINFEKVQRGMCFFEFAQKGTCKRSSEECWFTHEIPEQIRKDPQIRYQMSQSLTKIQELRQQAHKKKLPVTIPMFNQYQNSNNFLQYMQRPVLQGSLPMSPWSQQPLTNRMQ